MKTWSIIHDYASKDRVRNPAHGIVLDTLIEAEATRKHGTPPPAGSEARTRTGSPWRADLSIDQAFAKRQVQAGWAVAQKVPSATLGNGSLSSGSVHAQTALPSALVTGANEYGEHTGRGA